MSDWSSHATQDSSQEWNTENSRRTLSVWPRYAVETATSGISQMAADGGPMEDPRLDVGVIYTHEDDLMTRLLCSLRRTAQPLNPRLILVDNSDRGDVSAWCGVFPNTKVLRNRRRLEYAPNLNRIIDASTSKYVLLLNTDMYFDAPERCIWKMFQFMESQPGCGIATCRVHYPDGSHAPSARRFQTFRTILARRSRLGKAMQRTLDDYFYCKRDPQEAWECEWVSGCFMMIRRQALEDVGLFDLQFRKYFEDVDMCQRMAQAGWRVMYNGRTSCFHFEQRASKHLLSVDALKHAYAYLRWLMKYGFVPANSLAAQATPNGPLPEESMTLRRAA